MASSKEGANAMGTVTSSVSMLSVGKEQTDN